MNEICNTGSDCEVWSRNAPSTPEEVPCVVPLDDHRGADDRQSLFVEDHTADCDRFARSRFGLSDVLGYGNEFAVDGESHLLSGEDGFENLANVGVLHRDGDSLVYVHFARADRKGVAVLLL